MTTAAILAAAWIAIAIVLALLVGPALRRGIDRLIEAAFDMHADEALNLTGPSENPIYDALLAEYAGAL